MKKSFVLLALLFAAVFAFAEEYKIVSVTGQTYFQEKDGNWKKIEANMLLDEETVVKTSLNSEIVLSLNNQTYKIPAKKNNTIAELIEELSASKSTKIQKTGEIKKSTVDTSAAKKKKRISTAAERADTQDEDEVDLVDSEEYVEINEQDLEDLDSLGIPDEI